MTLNSITQTQTKHNEVASHNYRENIACGTWVVAGWAKVRVEVEYHWSLSREPPVGFKHSENCTLLDAVCGKFESSGEWTTLTGDFPFIDSVDLLNRTPDGSFNPGMSREIHSGENHPALSPYWRSKQVCSV